MDQKRSATPRWWVPAAACALLLAAALAARAAVPWSPGAPLHGPLAGGHVLLGVVLMLLLGGLATRFALRTRRGDGTAARLDAALTAVLAVSALALPMLLIAATPPPHAMPPPLRPTATAPATVRGGPSAGATGAPVVPPAGATAKAAGTSSLPWAAAAGALLVLAAALAARYGGALRRPSLPRRGRWNRAAPAARAPSPPADPAADPVAAGLAALAGPDDPRLAVIACYAALEDGLLDAGVPRHHADTPAELLDRAAAHGALRAGAGADLTALYLEARFSRHPFGTPQREAAHTALAALRTELAETAEAAASEAGHER